MFDDAAYDATERTLHNIERKLKKIYSRAAHESQEKLEKYLNEFKAEDEKKRLAVKSGELDKDEYLKWREHEILKGKRYNAVVDQLAADYANVDRLAMNMVNGYLPQVFAENGNFAMYELEKEMQANLNFGLYNKAAIEQLVDDKKLVLPKPSVDVPKDKRWNRRHIKSEIAQGILQGESVDKVAGRLTRVVGMDHSAAVRNARTAITGAQNGGRVETYRRAQELGIDIKQVWIATLDSRTRHSHAMMDGEMVDVGQKFSNGCRYPGDPSGPPWEIYNCRCDMRAHLMGLSFSDTGIERDSRIGGMTYDEWKSDRRSYTESVNNAVAKMQEGKHSAVLLNDGEKVSVIQRLTGVDDKTAQLYSEKVEAWSGNYYSMIRKYQRNGIQEKDVRDILSKDEKIIEDFIKRSPKWSGGVTYRGVLISEKDLDRYKGLASTNKKIEMLGTSSWSSDKDVSVEVARNGIWNVVSPQKVVFVSPTQTNGTSIMALSLTPASKEVLVSKKARYIVDRFETKDDITFVYLKEYYGK